MSATLQAQRQNEKHEHLLARLGVAVPRPRLDSVILTEVRRVDAGRATSGSVPPIRRPQDTRPNPPPAVDAKSTPDATPTKPPPPSDKSKREGGSPPPLRVGTTRAARARTQSGRWKPVAGPGGPSKALEAGKPTQAELVSNGVTVTAPNTAPQPGQPNEPPLDSDLANIMGDILASGERDQKRRAVGNKMRVSQESWYKDVFEAEHWLPLQPHNRARRIGQELKFIHDQVGIRTDFEILDVGCGDGLHSVELAKTGCSITGLDLSRSLLEIGLENANRNNAPVRFIEADMREMNFERRFDLIMCLNSTFGYFDDAENLRVLRAMARGLKPGGHLILDVINRDWVVAQCPERAWWEAPERVILEETDFDALTSRLRVKRSILREGDPSWEQNISMRAYAVHELPSLMHVTGLRVQSVSGDLAHPGTYLGAENRRLIVHATRDRG